MTVLTGRGKSAPANVVYLLLRQSALFKTESLSRRKSQRDQSAHRPCPVLCSWSYRSCHTVTGDEIAAGQDIVQFSFLQSMILVTG